MAATIRMHQIEATFENGRWHTKQEGLALSLDATTRAMPKTGYIPDYEAEVAHYVAERYGAEVIQVDPLPPPGPDSVE